MAAAVKYLIKRDGVFVYRRWIPEHLRASVGSQSFRKSLRTKDQAEAMRRAEHAEREYEALIASVANDQELSLPAPHSAPLTPIHIRRPVTQHDLEAIEQDRRRTVRRKYEPHVLRADTSLEDREFLDHLVRELELTAPERRRAITELGFDNHDAPHLPSPLNEARNIVEILALDAPEGSDAFGAIVAATRRGYLAGDHDVNEMLAGRLKPRVPAALRPVSIAAPLYSEAVTAYLDHRKLPPKTAREVQRYVEEFVALADDKRLDQYVRSEFVSFVQQRAGRVIGGKGKGSIMRPASEQSVAKALSFVRTPIEHAIHRDDIAFDGPNPALGIKIALYVQQRDDSTMPDKRPFRVGELTKLFQHPWFSGCESATSIHRPGTHRLAGAEYWVPMVALFTGCRVTELAGLRTSEVRLDSPHPHFVIRANEVRRLKTKAAARLVPILDALLDQGFAGYVERVRASGADRLFSDWEPAIRKDGSNEQAWYNSKLMRAFNRTVIPAVLADELMAGARQEVTFHGFRGAFKSMLGSSRYGLHPNVINEVVGHAKGELDRRYVGTILIEETYPSIHACRYEGLELPLASQ